MPKVIAFKSSERFDLVAAKKIHDNWDDINMPDESKQPWEVNGTQYDPKAILNKFISNASSNKTKGYGQIQTAYSFSSIRKTSGRRFVDKSLGLQSISRYIRHTIAHKHYNDIDVVNCHPTILEQYCKKRGWAAEHIGHYVQNRDQCIKELTSLGCDKDDMKQMIVSIVNNGYAKYETFADKHKPPAWLSNFVDQMPKIHKLMIDDPNNRQLINLLKKNDKQNIAGSLCNYLLCDIEDEILMCAINFLKSRNIPVDEVVLCFDGFMLLKELLDITSGVLSDLNAYIKEHTSYDVKFIVKPMDCIINLDDFDLEEEVSEYEKLKIKFEERVCKIMDPICFGYLRETGEYTFVNKTAIEQMFEEWSVTNGKVDVKFTKLWFEDSNKRCYERIVVDPSYTCPSNVLNLFPGFLAEKLDPVDDSLVDDLCTKVLKHFKDLLGECYDYYLDWMANIVQNPHKKSNVAIILKGLQGAGKDILNEWFHHHILGEKVSFQTAKADEILGRFANGCHNKVFVVFDEANGKDFFGKVDGLKNLITAKTINYEVKCVMSITEDLFTNFVFTTNNPNPIPIPSDDRRFVVVEVSGIHKGDSDYFTDLAKNIENKQVQRAFFQFLKKRDLSRYETESFQSARPITEAYTESQQMSLAPIHRYLSYLAISDNFSEYCMEATGAEFFKKYCDWCTERNHKNELSSTKFGTELSKFTQEKGGEGIMKRKSCGIMKYKVCGDDLKQCLIAKKMFDSEVF